MEEYTKEMERIETKKQEIKTKYLEKLPIIQNRLNIMNSGLIFEINE